MSYALRKRWTPDRVAKWRKTRARGMACFVSVCVLVWGGSMIAIMNLFHFLFTRILDLTYFKISLIIYPVGGLVFGLIMWIWTEASYLRAQGDSEKQP